MKLILISLLMASSLIQAQDKAPLVITLTSVDKNIQLDSWQILSLIHI